MQMNPEPITKISWFNPAAELFFILCLRWHVVQSRSDLDISQAVPTIMGRL